MRLDDLILKLEGIRKDYGNLPVNKYENGEGFIEVRNDDLTLVYGTEEFD